MIIWLEDPKKYRYLREAHILRGSRRGFKQGAQLNWGDFYKLIGYELLKHQDRGWFDYRVFWLKTYDDDCPDVARCHYDDGGKLAEGINIEKLLEENLQKAEVRCLDCKQFGSKRNVCFLREIRQSNTNQVVDPCAKFVPVDKRYVL
jgi:hypothetical protein